MPIKIILFLTFFYSFNLITLAQSTLNIKGIVLEDSSNKAIPYLAVNILETNTTTITNQQGFFSIKVPIEWKNKKINFILIGYEPLSLAIKDLVNTNTNNIIRLKSSNTSLHEVIVETDGARKFVREAIEKIPQNYPNKITKLEIFYRESEQKLDTNYQYIAESIMEIYKSSYEYTKGEHYKISKGRKKEFATPEKEQVTVFMFDMGLEGMDIVKKRDDFLSLKEMKEYDYSFDKFIKNENNEDVAIISAKSKDRKEPLDGKMYIHEATKAFIKIEFYYKEKTNNAYYNNAYYTGLANYRRIDGKWYWESAFLKASRFDKKKKEQLTVLTEIVVLEIDSLIAQKPDYVERVNKNSLFMRNIKIKHIDTTYWENKNIIQYIYKKRIDAKKDSLTKVNLEKDYEKINWETAKDLEKRIKKYKNRYIMSLFIFQNKIQHYAINISYQHPIQNFQFSQDYKNENIPYLIGFNMGLHRFYDNGFNIMMNVQTFGNRKIGGNTFHLGAGYRYNLNKRHRPIYINIGGNIGFFRQQYKILEVANNIEALNIRNKTFKQENIEISLRRNNLELTPFLKLSTDWNKNTEIFASLYYAIPIYERRRILFAQNTQDLFGRRIARLPLETLELQLLRDNQRVHNLETRLKPLRFELGITFKL